MGNDVMCTYRRLFQVGTLTILSLLLLGLAYTFQRARFIEKANTLFDPQERAFTGTFLPWPIGSPSLVGGIDPKADSRIRASLGYHSGSISTNGMTLIIHASDGTFFVHGR